MHLLGSPPSYVAGVSNIIIHNYHSIASVESSQNKARYLKTKPSKDNIGLKGV